MKLHDLSCKIRLELYPEKEIRVPEKDYLLNETFHIHPWPSVFLLRLSKIMNFSRITY